MSKEAPIKGLIPRLYKRTAMELGIFYWINGQRVAFPNSISIDLSLDGFYKFNELTEEDLPRKTAKQIYTRMNHELIESLKNG